MMQTTADLARAITWAGSKQTYYIARLMVDKDLVDDFFRAWVQQQVELGRQRFREGKHYLDELNVLRCSIVGHWYCARFECVLNAIERDGYILRAVYKERYRLSSWLRINWLGVSVTFRHVARRARRLSGRKRNLGKTKGVELAA